MALLALLSSSCASNASGNCSLVSRDFLNSSTQPTSWCTATVELIFRGGPAHVFTLAGVDRDRSEQGYDENFAWAH